MSTNKNTAKQKVLIVILSIVCVVAFGVGIYYTTIGIPPTKKKHMREYYQNDANYYSISGIIKRLDREKRSIVFSEVVDSDELLYLNLGYRVFAPNIDALWEGLDLNEGDVIEIITAKSRFWDGYAPPIVSIVFDGVEYLSFEDGKAALLEWVNNLK